MSQAAAWKAKLRIPSHGLDLALILLIVGTERLTKKVTAVPAWTLIIHCYPVNNSNDGSSKSYAGIPVDWLRKVIRGLVVMNLVKIAENSTAINGGIRRAAAFGEVDSGNSLPDKGVLITADEIDLVGKWVGDQFEAMLIGFFSSKALQ